MLCLHFHCASKPYSILISRSAAEESLSHTLESLYDNEPIRLSDRPLAVSNKIKINPRV